MDSSAWIGRTSQRAPWLGPLLFIGGTQYFLVQTVVALRFSPIYSLARNTISDLGNTSCGIYNHRAVCSPLYLLMNVSFVVLGFTMIAGSLLLCQQLKPSRMAATGFTMFASGGIGTILVGLFPENTISLLHGTGAALPFLVGNLSLLLLSSTLAAPKLLTRYTACTGIVALIALGMYLSGYYAGLGQGGVERIIAYPQTCWMIIAGLYYMKQLSARAGYSARSSKPSRNTSP